MTLDDRSSDFSNRWNEEINKARQIISGNVRNDGRNWEDVIIEPNNMLFQRKHTIFVPR